MHSILIERWNERVNPEDTIFHIGDFAFRDTQRNIKSLIKQLNGNKIFIKGNHDSQQHAKIIIDDLTITLAGKTFQLIHNPNQGSPWYYLVLCGHVHNRWKFKTITSCDIPFDVCNVGCDLNGFYPISIETILKEYSNWKKQNVK